MAKGHKHVGKSAKVGKSIPQSSKGNLKLPKAQASVHVTQKKDTMAANVGGSAHMSPGKKAMGSESIMLSGGKGAPKKHKDNY